MPILKLEVFIKPEALPLIEAMKGEHEETEEFLRRALELGLHEVLGDAARVNSDRAVTILRDHTTAWTAFKSLFSVQAPPPKSNGQKQD